MFIANNAGNTGITFLYDDTEGVNDGTVTATVSVASTDLTDTANVSRLNAVQTFSANNTFTADVDLTGANATATTQALADSTTKLSTTAFVQNEITNLDLANTYQAKDASLDDITGIADGDFVLGDGVDSFEKVSVTAGVESFLKSAGGSSDLSDTTIAGKAEGQVLRIGADNTTFENSVLSFGDLSNTGVVVQTSACYIRSFRLRFHTFYSECEKHLLSTPTLLLRNTLMTRLTQTSMRSTLTVPTKLKMHLLMISQGL